MTEIRSARVADAGTLAILLHESVRHAGRAAYSDAECAAWSPAVPDAALFVAAMRQGTMLVAVEGDNIVGFGNLGPTSGHLDMLYVRYDRIDQGIGSLLLRALESAARDQGARTLYTEASRMLQPRLAWFGYTLIEAETVYRHGIAIERFRMTKSLERT